MKKLAGGVILLLLAACGEDKKPAEPTAPAPADATVAAPAPMAPGRVLTSGDTWPSTSHDTLRLGSRVLRLTPVSAADFRRLARPGLPARPDTTDSPALAQTGGQVSRTGIRLRLLPANGKEVVIAHDTADTDTMAYYHYWGSLPAAHQWVLSVRLYEGSAVALVDQRTGRRTIVWGQPVVSPDGRYLLTHSADLAAAYDANGLQLYRIEPTGPRLLWQRQLGSWSPDEVRWLDNQTVLIEQGTGPGLEKGEPQSGYVLLDLAEVM